MLRRRHKSRSVSWNDNIQVIYFSKAEPMSPGQENVLSAPHFSNDETDAENMTPFEFDCYRRRTWYIEKIRILLRDICFDDGIVDRLPEKKIKYMDESFEPLYKPFKMDRKKIQVASGPQGLQNKTLRWRIMSQIWKLLREHIFDQLSITDKDPISDPILTVMRDIAAEKIKQFIEPFKAAAAKDLDIKIDDVGDAARELFHMLRHDSSANYSFYDIKDLSQGESMLLYSVLVNRAQRVDICGAAHRDPSMDVICITAAGGLMRHVRGFTAIETKAWVVLYRPGPEERAI
ncbi:hypothetical protein ACHAQJ_006100 [Trichoderma viride]